MRFSAVIERLHGSQETARRSPWASTAVTVGSVARPFTLILLSTDTLERAADLMADPGVSVLPIMQVETERLSAVVTRSDILDAYRSLAAT
jgi:CBS domain-containing protein